MPQFTVSFIKREEIAEGTMAFHFTKPSGFSFKAGQHTDLTIENPPETDAEGNSRTFSVASAPSDTDIVVATRMRDTAFKRVLKKIPEGQLLTMEGPFGSMTLHNDAARPAVMLAGGIGITPFRSMVREATENLAYRQAGKLLHKIFLFYSNRRPEDAPFLAELQELERQNPNFKLVATMTKAEDLKEEWNGERGLITAEMIKKYAGDMAKPIYYIAGPPQMALSMREMLNGAGVDDDNIRSEEFSGY